MKYFKKHKILKILFIIFLLFCLLYFNGGPAAEKTEYGITFSPDQATALGLDWKQTYKALLDELKVRQLRLSAYWDRYESEKDKYNFADLDFQLSEAQNRGAKVVLSVGRRLPRWPECHDPSWIKDLKTSEMESSLLSYIETVVGRYKNNDAVKMWQVENEPFVSSFGPCPKVDQDFLDKEIALVKKLDPAKPVLISDSGELSMWTQAYRRGDVFGTTLYRYVYNDVFNMYWVSYVPFWTYRLRAGLMNFLYGRRQAVIIELQAEPWTTKGITNTSIEEQFKTMSPEKFDKLLSIAQATGFSPQYLWGAEWWYYMKEKQGHPEFWEKAKELFKQSTK